RRRPLDDRRLPWRDRRQATLHQRLDLRRRPDQHRGAAPSPADGTGHQLDEGHPRRAGAADLRAADLSEEPLRRPRSSPSRRLSQGSHRATGSADAGTRDLEGAVASRVVSGSVEPSGAHSRARPLKIGLVVPTIEEDDGHTPRWNEIKALAQHAEATGFDSLWMPDHLIYDYGEPDRPLHGVWECWSILTSLAAVTTRVELGTTVVCTSFRNPALLAKMADTVDEISGGRLILGLGAGYHEPEFLAYGYPFDHLFGRFE